MRITLLLIDTVSAHIAPGRADRGLTKKLDKLQGMVETLQTLSEANSQSRPSHNDYRVMQLAREVIAKGTQMREASLAVESCAGGQGAANRSIRVAEWVSTLGSISCDQRRSDPSDIVSNVPSIFSGDETRTVETSATSAQCALQAGEAGDAVGDDSDDDLDMDLAKAALDTGTKAFETQEWEEADSLLQEALQVLQQLPKRQRAFCDVFDLHYRLAVCSYHTQAPVDAEEALMSLVQQSASSDRQREYIYNATHLLSHLYIRMGQLENARMECEKALQARRRLLGKQSDASLESTALMVHIYVLLNNRARAKSYLAMIPEIRRDAIVKGVEESLGTKLEDIELQSPLTRSISDMSDLAITRSQSRTSAASPQLPMEDYCFGPVSSRMSQLPTARLRQSHQSITSTQADSEHLRSTTVTSLSSLRSRSGSRTTDKERASEAYSTYPEAVDATLYPLRSPLDEGAAFKGKTLSRKEVLDKIGCQPKDGIEDAVCDGDHPAFANLLSSKKVSWKSKLRKHVRSERVTALHFAAVFGEVEMARRLLGANFNINETPYGYSTSLTPMKFAIGARQVTMVEFLVANGARPSGSDSWSTLAGQLMNRSWLNKTMSEADKDIVPTQMIAILKILIKHGWHMNAPFETAGGTVLHQAVSFWTGSYKWDLHLRTAMTSFLCEIGANPRQSNREGKTPYDMASASGHQDLLMILDRAAKKKPSMDEPVKPD